MTERHLLQRQLDQFAPVWERRASETPQWFGRFVRYLDLGPNRTLAGAYNADRYAAWEAGQATGRKGARKGRGRDVAPPEEADPPGNWRDHAAAMQWRYRARQHDEYRLIEQQLQIATERETEGIARRSMLRDSRAALAGELARMTGADGRRRDRRLGQMTGADVIRSIKTIADLQRTEYGELPPVQRLAMTDANGNDIAGDDSDIIRVDLSLLTAEEGERFLAFMDEVEQRQARARAERIASEEADAAAAEADAGTHDRTTAQPHDAGDELADDDGETF